MRLIGDSGERGERDRILLVVDVGLVGGGVIGFVVSAAAGWGGCVVVFVFASVFIDVSREIGVCSSSGDIVLGLVLEREDLRGRVTRLYRRDVVVVVFVVVGLGVGLRSGFGRGEELLEGRDEVEKVSQRRRVVVLVLVLVVVLVGFSSPG